ncbi:MAG: RNA-binding transcriptional accessory protein, partial [Treponema sp.]|nr:RNA-binding transcriptional accessory protein [Treponema sp.]
MELTEECIGGLAVDGAALLEKIALDLGRSPAQAAAVVELLAGGCTVPFIARYRKEKTGGLDEVQIRDIEHRYNAGKNLEERRIEIIRAIFGQGRLTESLYENIMKAAAPAELEDIYGPYKRKKKTRAMLAAEMGLGPLAEAMKRLETEPLKKLAAEFVRAPADAVSTAAEGTADAAPAGPASVDEALQGAMDIIAEEVSLDSGNRSSVKAFYLKDGRIIVKGKGGEEVKNASTYKMYWDYTEALSRIKPHRVLAINRGEREGALEITVDVDENAAAQMLQARYELYNDYHKTAVEDGLKRLLSPAVIREIRGDQGDA